MLVGLAAVALHIRSVRLIWAPAGLCVCLILRAPHFAYPLLLLDGVVRKKHMHQPGIEPGSHRWQRCILPLTTDADTLDFALMLTSLTNEVTREPGKDTQGWREPVCD